MLLRHEVVGGVVVVVLAEVAVHGSGVLRLRQSGGASISTRRLPLLVSQELLGLLLRQFLVREVGDLMCLVGPLHGRLALNESVAAVELALRLGVLVDELVGV